MKSKTKQIIMIGVVLFQSLFAYPLITMAEENESKSVNTETTLEPKVALEEKTPQKPTLTNNLKQEKTVLQAGETYETVFPDAALATVIAKAATGSEDITQEVSQTDLNKITSLTATSKGIVDLTGIDLLSKLTSLSISGNQITDISALNGLVNLSNLNVSNNKITSFNLNANSNLPMLSAVDIRSNNLKNINVQDQPKLWTFKCDTGSSSELTEVTLKNLPTLIVAGNGSSAYQNDIVFSSTPGLSKVILENLPSISSSVRLDRCAIEELVINNLPKVSMVNISNNKITTLEGLENLSAVNTLYVSENLVTEIESMHAFPKLQKLELGWNALTNVVMDQVTAEKFPLLRTMNVRGNNLIKINIQDQPKLWTFECDTGSSSELTEVTLKNLPILIAVGNGSSAYQDDIVFSSTPGLSKVILENLPSTSSEVKLDHCAIEELVINNLPKVSVVIISYNKITTLEGLENLSAVSKIDAYENLVTEIENLHAFPKLQTLTVDNNHISVLPTSLKTENPVLTTLSAMNQTITLKQKVIVSDLVLDNEVKNFGQITTAKSISNKGTYQNNQIKWLFEDIKSVNAVDYQFSEPVQEATIQGTFSGKVTQPIKASKVPVISADAEMNYPKNETVSEAAFFKDISASVTDDATLTSDFESVVDFAKAGTYEVTLNAVNEDGVKAASVTVLVHIAKSPAPVITADKEITYTKNAEVSITEYFAAIHAKTNDGSPIESDFATAVNWGTAGDYTVTLRSTNEDGVEAIPVEVTVHIAKSPAPVITADKEITYAKNAEVSITEFLAAIHAKTSDGSSIEADLDTAVTWGPAGGYTVTLRSTNEDGVEAIPVEVTVHIAKSPAPVITADKEITYAKNAEVSITEFLAAIHAKTSDGSSIEADLDTAVTWGTAGGYTVTLRSTNEDGVEAIPVEVTVHIAKSPAPVITADKEITYAKNAEVSITEFLAAIHAKTSDGSSIEADLDTAVTWGTAGGYTVTLRSTNEDGVEAIPVEVTVHIAKSPAPVITADKEITYAKNAEVSITEFLAAIHAKTSDGSPIDSDFATAVIWSTAGDYTVTLKSTNEDGVEAIPVEVTVHIAKSPAPVITADKEITYAKNAEVSITEFLAAIHAKTSDGSPIESDFATAVIWSTAGDYTVTLKSTNEDGVEAIPVEVKVHIVEPLAPTISNVTFDVDDVQTTESLEAGELISEPLSPTKEGYTFIGWYDSKTGGNKWDFTTDKMPAYNIILYAQFSKDTNKAEAAGGDKPSTPSSIKVSPTGQSESGNLENRSNIKLPATGDDNATVLLVGFGLLMLGLFIRLTQKKRAK
ncbi:LapB repeat-containing protein [Listeria monocytogenes]|nr:LapB repeat-containing protein [Listeria monocytogenes]MCI2565821.1 LapB repeat-containing protein [Listeria monocytogenes]